MATQVLDPLQRVRSVYQPIVDLRSGAVVAVEALARGVAGGSPDALFAAARGRGSRALQQLDRTCLRAALDGLQELPGPVTVFLNAEPETLAALSSAAFSRLGALVPDKTRIVVEITERALLERPGQLLEGVRRVRALGWSVAVDDVGPDPAALAVMPFLAPDVIKLDLSLLRARPSLEVAAVVHAVGAQAERSGALVLAEGIETQEQLDRALAMGARLGQGYRFGHPVPAPDTGRAPLDLPLHLDHAPHGTPFTLLAQDAPGQRTTVPLLAALARQVERQALLLDELAVVLASFQTVRSFTPATRRRYEALASATAMTAVVGPDVPDSPAEGVHGSRTAPEDPLGDEWSVAVVSPHHAVALAAREAPRGPDGERRLDYVLTYDRDRVLGAASLLLSRVQPLPGRRAAAPPPQPPDPAGLRAVPPDELPGLLLRAVVTSRGAITIADARAPDLPLVYVNQAFLRLTGYEESEVLGRNCRFLQGPDTDRALLRPLARRLAAGRDARAVLLNHRKDGTPFWNELVVSPVHDAAGRLTHFIGNQVDVTTRVEREERAAALAYRDALTGLANRAHLLEHLELELVRAQRAGSGVAVLFLDLDAFKAVNDRHGHRAGDAVLAQVAERLARGVRGGDLLARLGGDEFVVVLVGLPLGDDAPARAAAAKLHRLLEAPLPGVGAPLQLTASTGIALFPQQGRTAEELLDAADAAMYRDKRERAR